MRKRAIAASAAFILGPLTASVRAVIPVEQIESYTDSSAPYIHYAPVNFGSSSSVTLGPADEGGGFGGLTFHALDTAKEGSSYSDHAYTVGQDMYGSSTVAYPYVTDIYVDPYDDFLNNTVQTQASTGVGPAPGNFETGVYVVNTSYVVDYGTKPPNTATTDTDALRRMDSMINDDNVTFVASAVTSVGDGNTYHLNWSCFNSLAVSGGQTFSPVGGPGKQHADLYGGTGDASFAAAQVSSYATALDGNAQEFGQTDALNNVVTRSLLMAGADKTLYSRNTSNNLGTVYGAGEADYQTSLGILQGGEKPLLKLTGGSASPALATSQQGWAYGNVSAGAQTVILFNSSNTITSLTASLNWNVNSPIASGNINTSNAALQFPNLTLEVRPVTYISGSEIILGANQSNTMLHSTATGDNVQYLYDTTSLPAGNYAFLITGDPSLTPLVGFSYTLGGSFASQWNNSAGSSWSAAGNWTNGIPDGRGAQANLLAAPGLSSPGTITLDGNYTVGQLTFNNSNGYTITIGTGGTLFLNDTGDSSGVTNPLISVGLGSHVIDVPISMASGATISIASGASLNLGGSLGGSGNVVKTGSGTLTVSSAMSANSFDLQGGTTTVTPAGSFISGAVTVESGGTLNFAASTTSGILVRSVPVALTVNGGGTLALSPSAVTANRQLLSIAAGLSLAGSTDHWTGKLDLANNDLDLPGASLVTITNQIKQGYSNGSWNGSGGIVSSSAAANSAHLTALGVIQNNQSGTALYTAGNPFDTITPGATDILVKYTYYGDTNLDGKVDGSDYSRIDNGYLLKLTGWFNGDFNYDGVVNGSDYTLIDNAFNTQGAVISTMIAGPGAIATAQVAAVPEPGVLGCVGVAAFPWFLSRRKRRIGRIRR